MCKYDVIHKTGNSLRNISLRRLRWTEPRPGKKHKKFGEDQTCSSGWTESSRSTDPHVIGATCDGQTDRCARRMVCRRRRKSTSSSLLQQHGPSWPSVWRQELLCASPRKPIWHLSSTVSRHTCQGVQSATRMEPDRTLVG